jgi:hypothetical protein
MLKSSVIAAFVLALNATHCSQPARADGLSVHVHLDNFGAAPLNRFIEQPSALIINVPQPTTDEGIKAQEERIKKWEDYCQPRYVVDRYGVSRAVYAKVGCAFGRIAD